MFGSRQTLILPVDQLAPVREDLQAALAASDERERPGLQAALRVVESYSPQDLRRRWVAGVLAAAEADPRANTVQAVKALRGAVPGLSLTDAVALVKEAGAAPGDGAADNAVKSTR
jgi:hypothetical protein